MIPSEITTLKDEDVNLKERFTELKITAKLDEKLKNEIKDFINILIKNLISVKLLKDYIWLRRSIFEWQYILKTNYLEYLSLKIPTRPDLFEKHPCTECKYYKQSLTDLIKQQWQLKYFPSVPGGKEQPIISIEPDFLRRYRNKLIGTSENKTTYQFSESKN